MSRAAAARVQMHLRAEKCAKWDALHRSLSDLLISQYKGRKEYSRAGVARETFRILAEQIIMLKEQIEYYLPD